MKYQFTLKEEIIDCAYCPLSTFKHDNSMYLYCALLKRKAISSKCPLRVVSTNKLDI